MAVTTDANVAEMQAAMEAMRSEIAQQDQRHQAAMDMVRSAIIQLDQRHQRTAAAVLNHEGVIFDGFRASMIQGSVLPPGVGLLGDLAGGGHTPLMLSATSFACGAHCLPRARHPTFDTAAKVELPLSHSHPHTRPHT